MRLLRVASVALLLSLVALRCGGAKEGAVLSPGPTGTGSPVVSPATTPTGTESELAAEAGFRAFAATLDAALERVPVAFLRERMKTAHVVCGPEDVPPGLGGPACERVGQEFEGFAVSAWRSEGATVPVETAATGLERLFERALPSEGDEFGDGAPRVYALNIGDGRYDAIVAVMIERPREVAGEGALRVALNTAWTFADGRWLLTGVMYAYVLGDELLRPADEARQLFPHWERYGGG